jgi:hypothetical protein
MECLKVLVLHVGVRVSGVYRGEVKGRWVSNQKTRTDYIVTVKVNSQRLNYVRASNSSPESFALVREADADVDLSGLLGWAAHTASRKDYGWVTRID